MTQNILKICLVAIAATALMGCVRIPPEAITLNQKVSSGIEAMRENSEAVIVAWRDTALTISDERFDEVYDAVETRYRDRRNIPPGTALSSDQVRDVAALVSLVRDEVRSKIYDYVDEMIKTNNKNAEDVISANDGVTDLLISAQSVIDSRTAVVNELKSLSPVTTDVLDFLNQTQADILNAL